MSFKKFALLILTVVAISGFNAKPVSASANNDVTTQVEENIQIEADVLKENTTVSTDSVVSEDTQTTDDNDVATSVVAAKSNSETKTTSKVTTKSTAKSSAKTSYSKSDLRLMASIINCEAGAEGYQGKIAVGIVVMNRVASKNFPNTIKKVIYQKNQFSPVRNGMLAKKLKQYDAGKTGSAQWKSCISAAKKVLTGQRTIIYKGKVKSLKGYHFFSVVLPGARIKLGGHRFK